MSQSSQITSAIGQRIRNAMANADNNQWDNNAYGSLTRVFSANDVEAPVKILLLRNCTALTPEQRTGLQNILDQQAAARRAEAAGERNVAAPEPTDTPAQEARGLERNAYVPKKADLVATVRENMQAIGVRYEYSPGRIVSVTSGTVDIGAAYAACAGMEICRNIAAMTPVITAALANDDAPWATATYGTLENNTKIALTAYVNQLKMLGQPAGSLITMFNRCGYILASQSQVAGAWAKGSAGIEHNEPATWFGHLQRISAYGGKASEIGQKKLNAQVMWAITHKNELQ